jgi:hypothetical protein
MAIYKVVLNGTYRGQDVKNILYYRNGIAIDLGGLTIGGTVEVADAVRTMVWTPLRAILSASYILQSITAYVYDEGTFQLLYQNPITVNVNEAGMVQGLTNGPAVCAILNFQLEPTSILTNGIKPPKKGYLAIGPLTDAQVGIDGDLDMSVPGSLYFTAVQLAMSNNVETLLPPAVFFPIRVHQDKVLGVFKITSYADIRGSTFRGLTSFRRSRMPEA